MAICSAFTLLMCSAFAEQAARRLGAPPILVLYGLAGVSGLLAVTLYLGADLNGISLALYRWLVRIHAVLLIGLTAYVCLFVYADSRGGVLDPSRPTFVLPPKPMGQVAASAAIFAAPCLVALVALRRLSTLALMRSRA